MMEHLDLIAFRNACRPRGQALGFGLDGAAFGAMHTSQQLGGLHAAAPAAQNTFSPPAGNPFG